MRRRHILSLIDQTSELKPRWSSTDNSQKSESWEQKAGAGLFSIRDNWASEMEMHQSWSPHGQSAGAKSKAVPASTHLLTTRHWSFCMPGVWKWKQRPWPHGAYSVVGEEPQSKRVKCRVYYHGKCYGEKWSMSREQRACIWWFTIFF